MQIKQFKLMFNKKSKATKNVGGPIAIVKMMPKEIDWVAFGVLRLCFLLG